MHGARQLNENGIGLAAVFVRNSHQGLDAVFLLGVREIDGVGPEPRWGITIVCAWTAVGGTDVSIDPIGFSGGLTNLYAYVGDDPVNHADSRGLGTFAQEITCGLTLFGVGGNTGPTVIQDDKDNLGGGWTWSGGGDVLFGAGCTYGVQVTNADTIHDATSTCSVATGGAGSTPKLVVGGEFIGGTQNNGRPYRGVNLYVGPRMDIKRKPLGVSAPGYNLHGMFSCTQLLASGNLHVQEHATAVNEGLRRRNEVAESSRDWLFRLFGRDEY